MAEELAAGDAIHISTVVAPDIAIMYCPLVAWSNPILEAKVWFKRTLLMAPLRLK
jgi:hypothetical protein